MTWNQTEPVSDASFYTRYTRFERAKAYNRKAESRVRKKRRMRTLRALISCCLLWIFTLAAPGLTMETGVPHLTLPPGVLMCAIFTTAGENGHAP